MLKNKPLLIYLAEDNLDHKELVEDMFDSSEHPFKLVHAPNGLALIDRLKQNTQKIDLILLDIKMPLMGGLETLRQLRAQETYKDTPIIIITTSTMTSDISKAVSLGATQFLTKPLCFADIKPYISGNGKDNAHPSD